jgi:acyl carrier protein
LIDNQHRASEDGVLAYMRQHLGAVIGDPELLHTDITLDTTFGGDLELESINFVAFLAKKQVDDMVSLTVGDVVRYVASCLQKGGESMRELQAHG